MSNTMSKTFSNVFPKAHPTKVCVWGKRGTVIINVLCYGHQTMAQGLAASKSFVQSQIPCSTPSRDIYILNKIARWYGCFLRIEKHYPTVWEGVRNIFSPFLVEGIARLEGGIKCLPRVMSHMNPTPFQSTRGSAPAS